MLKEKKMDFASFYRKLKLLNIRTLKVDSYSINRGITTTIYRDTCCDISSIEEFILKIMLLDEEFYNENYDFPHPNIYKTIEEEILNNLKEVYLCSLPKIELKKLIDIYLNQDFLLKLNIEADKIKEVFYFKESKDDIFELHYDNSIYFILNENIYAISTFYSV